MKNKKEEIIQTNHSLYLLGTCIEMIEKAKQSRIDMLENKNKNERFKQFFYSKKTYSKQAIEKLYWLRCHYFEKMSEAKYRKIGIKLCEGAYESLGKSYRQELNDEKDELQIIDDLLNALKYIMEEKLIVITRRRKKPIGIMSRLLRNLIKMKSPRNKTQINKTPKYTSPSDLSPQEKKYIDSHYSSNVRYLTEAEKKMLRDRGAITD